MNWSNWVQTVQTQPEAVPSLLDEYLGFKELGDSGQAQAIVQAMQNRDGNLFFLEGEDEELLVYQFKDDWYVRQLNGTSSDESIAEFVNYSAQLADFVLGQKETKTIGDYYSLRPLIYGGEYWLEKICADEINRFKDLEEDSNLSVIMISWESGLSLFELVESLRRGDRIGYFEDLLGILLPFTGRDQAEMVRDRLRDRFRADRYHVWHWQNEFENYFELETRVKEFL